MDTKIKSPPAEPELAPPCTPLHIAVAPGLLGCEHGVVREPDESEESYQSRCEPSGALTTYARNP